MPTKADLEAQIVELKNTLAEREEEHLAFRKNAVKVALAASRRHGFCLEARKVLKRAGLDDLMPPVFMVQYRYTPASATRRRRRWIWEDQTDQYRSIAGAKRANAWPRVDESRHEYRLVRLDGDGSIEVVETGAAQ